MSYPDNIYHHFPGLKMENLDLFNFQAFQLINLWLQKSFLLNKSPKIILTEDTELWKTEKLPSKKTVSQLWEKHHPSGSEVN